MADRLTPEQLIDIRERLLHDAEDWARWYPHLASSADLAAVLRAAARDARTLARVRAWTEPIDESRRDVRQSAFRLKADCKREVAALLRDEED